MELHQAMEWHQGRDHGLTEALVAVEAVRQIAELNGAGMAVMIPLDEAVAQIRLLIAAAEDEANPIAPYGVTSQIDR